VSERKKNKNKWWCFPPESERKMEKYDEDEDGKMGVDFGFNQKQIWAFGIVLWIILILATILGG
jgi:hypothetical protein